MTEPRVFLVQRPCWLNRETGMWEDKLDLTPAEDFGEIHEILPPGNVSSDMASNLRDIREGMRSFSNDDFLILLGDPVAMSIAACVAMQKTDGRIKMLKWDKFKNAYDVYEVDFRYPNQLKLVNGR